LAKNQYLKKRLGYLDPVGRKCRV